MLEEQSDVLLVRVWMERDSGEFRARMTRPRTSRSDGTGGDLTVAVAMSTEGVFEAVRAWLGEFLASVAAR